MFKNKVSAAPVVQVKPASDGQATPFTSPAKLTRFRSLSVGEAKSVIRATPNGNQFIKDFDYMYCHGGNQACEDLYKSISSFRAEVVPPDTSPARTCSSILQFLRENEKNVAVRDALRTFGISLDETSYKVFKAYDHEFCIVSRFNDLAPYFV